MFRTLWRWVSQGRIQDFLVPSGKSCLARLIRMTAGFLLVSVALSTNNSVEQLSSLVVLYLLYWPPYAPNVRDPLYFS